MACLAACLAPTHHATAEVLEVGTYNTALLQAPPSQAALNAKHRPFRMRTALKCKQGQLAGPLLLLASSSCTQLLDPV